VPVLRDVQRLGLVTLCQVTAVLLTALVVNDQFNLYEWWGDLFGTDQVQAGAPQPRETVHGAASGITSTVWVLLPPGYDTAAEAARRYPVVVFLPGYPGTPTTWLHAMHLQQVLDGEVAAQRVPPVIAVLPTMNVAAPRDTECTNVPNGPQVAGWHLHRPHHRRPVRRQ
jgi:hypothetical protein